jgi:hypothetical protein
MVLVPIVLLMVLRVNAALVFLSLCLGNVLVQFVAPDASSFMTLFAAHAPHSLSTTHASNTTIQLILLLLPTILTTIFMIRTVRSGARLALNLLPATGVALLGSLLIVPLLPAGLSHTILSSSLWGQVQRTQDLIVGSSALICLLALWLQRPKTNGDDKHAKH